jgi:hypothetical protein
MGGGVGGGELYLKIVEDNLSLKQQVILSFVFWIFTLLWYCIPIAKGGVRKKKNDFWFYVIGTVNISQQNICQKFFFKFQIGMF